MPAIHNPDSSPAAREITFDGTRLTIILVVMIIPFYFLGDRLFHWLWHDRLPVVTFIIPLWIKIVSLLLAVVIHEFIHGAIFALYAPRGFRSVTFGISASLGAIYCHCSDPVKVKHYRRAGLAPLLILGLLPLAAGLATGVTWFKTFGLLLTIGGFGDLLVWIKMLRYDPNLIIRDHPDKLGFIIE
jgi:hypothetical protein